MANRRRRLVRLGKETVHNRRTPRLMDGQTRKEKRHRFGKQGLERETISVIVPTTTSLSAIASSLLEDIDTSSKWEASEANRWAETAGKETPIWETRKGKRHQFGKHGRERGTGSAHNDGKETPVR